MQKSTNWKIIKLINNLCAHLKKKTTIGKSLIELTKKIREDISNIRFAKGNITT